jgi:hypothetical protein
MNMKMGIRKSTHFFCKKRKIGNYMRKMYNTFFAI